MLWRHVSVSEHVTVAAHGDQDVLDIELKTVSPNRQTDRAVVFAAAFAIVLAMAEVVLDVGTWVELDIATIYGIPLVLAAFTRNKRLLWGLMVALTLATFITYALQMPGGAFEMREPLFVNRLLDAVALLLTAGLLHVWMVSLDIREAQAQLLQEQNRRLEAANGLLVAHETQIVRQNEELIHRRREAEDASGRKTRLLNAISHDIRNPVNTINLMAEVICRTAEDPALVIRVPQMARRLQSNAQSLVALVSEALDFAHLDSASCNVARIRFRLTRSSTRSAATSVRWPRQSRCAWIPKFASEPSACERTGSSSTASSPIW